MAESSASSVTAIRTRTSRASYLSVLVPAAQVSVSSAGNRIQQGGAGAGFLALVGYGFRFVFVESFTTRWMQDGGLWSKSQLDSSMVLRKDRKLRD